MQNITLSILFLTTTMPLWLGIVIPVVALAVGAYVALFVSNKKVGSAREQQERIIENANAEAERI